jgi:branched-chain amino acid transport system substrate-binding protein
MKLAKILVALLYCSFLIFVFLHSVSFAESAQETFKRAEKLYSTKNYSLAIKDYEQVIDSGVEGEIIPLSYVRIGMCNYHLGDFGLAADAFDRVLIEYSYSKYADDASFFSAKAYFALGDYPTSAARLLRVIYMGSDSRYYDRAINGLTNLTETALTADQLSWALDTVEPKEAVGEVLLSIAEKEGDKGRYNMAMVILYDLSERYSAYSFSSNVESLIEKLRKSFAPLANRLGVLVPLSGDYEVYGRQVANAVTMAVEEYNAKKMGPEVELYIMDSGADPETTKKAYQTLVDIDRTIAVIGPMFTDEAVALGDLTKTSKVPMLSPTAGSASFLTGGDYLFRCAMTNRLQSQVLAKYAFDHLHLRRYAILYPATDYGSELRDEFKSAVEKLGGKTVAEVEYPLAVYDTKEHKVPDYTGQVKKVKYAHPDAIFIPGGYDEIILLAPQIAYSHISATILGANGWDESRVARMGAKYVEGVYFTSAFFRDTQNPQAQQFIVDYNKKYGDDPDYIGAQAYDSAEILLTILTKGVTSGEEMKNMLAKVSNFEGITGRITLRGGEDNDCVKDVTILTIKEGTILQVN